MRPGPQGAPKSAESLIGLAVAVGVLGYLMYTLLRPERF